MLLRCVLAAAAVWAAVATGVASPPAAAAPGSAPPSPGVVGRCVVVEVYDGDTVTVEFTIAARVRLLDCWAPEIRTRDDAEKAAGLASRDALAERLGFAWDAEARRWRGRAEALIEAPFGGAATLGHLFTLERLIARVWVAGEEIGEAQRRAGHAWATKADLQGAIPPRPQPAE